jgi:hypothetical protein
MKTKAQKIVASLLEYEDGITAQDIYDRIIHENPHWVDPAMGIGHLDELMPKICLAYDIDPASDLAADVYKLLNGDEDPIGELYRRHAEMQRGIDPGNI